MTETNLPESKTPSGRRLLVVNQVLGPLMVQLLEDLQARGVSCRALTGWVDAPDGGEVSFEVLAGRKLVKAPAWKRVWTWARFTLQGAWALGRHRGTPSLVVTNPPWTMLVMPLLKRLTGLRYALLVYDIYPDVMERMGMLKPGGLVARCWRGLSRRAMLRADGVVTIGRRMAGTLAGHLRPGDDVEIEVIPNWADTDVIRPIPREDNGFAREHGLSEKFTVLYSGAFGATHDVESIIEAAGRLVDLPDVQFVLIGGGTRRREVEELVAERNLPNLTLLPLQPMAVVPYSFASADLAIVCLDEGYEGISVPSKTYFALAAGAGILAVSPDDTELTDLVAEQGVGVHIHPHSPQEMADAIRALRADRDRLRHCKYNARDVAEREYSRAAGTSRMAEFLSRVLGV